MEPKLGTPGLGSLKLLPALSFLDPYEEWLKDLGTRSLQKGTHGHGLPISERMSSEEVGVLFDAPLLNNAYLEN